MKTIKAFLLSVWNALDGYKTKISAGISTFIFVLNGCNTEVLIGYWHLPGIPYLVPISQTLGWIAALFGGTGLVHGIAKSRAASASAIPQAAVPPITPTPITQP
jgi:hypothetical protein